VSCCKNAGKPITEARGEVAKCAWACRYYVENAEQFLAREPVETDASRSWVSYEPLGPVLAIMPWNFPLWQVIRFAAPALMAGNVGLLKHAPDVPGCAQALEALFTDAGYPQGVFQNLAIDNERTAAVIADPRVRAVTLTGSVGAGRAVAAAAGAALKPSVLELGGSDPCIVLADADLDEAVEGAMIGRFLNSGQSCIAAKRLIVEDAVHDAFVDKLTAAIDRLVIGNPMDDATQIGPMAREDLRGALHDQVWRSVAAGAELVRGGKPWGDSGWFYEPTLLIGVTPGMAAFDEETFGPAASVVRARDLDHALELADDTTFGLGASIWTADVERALGVAHRIASGHLSINGIVKSDPRLPFGGVRDSGYGRELSRAGMLAFVNARATWVK
jgi:succinate-semialdehyde dehydrogenase/glutarate-semialdehyde dehydrogenase